MTVDEFAATTGLSGPLLEPAYTIFQEEADVRRKTRAARCADLAEALRRLGVPEETVHTAIHELVKGTRR